MAVDVPMDDEVDDAVLTQLVLMNISDHSMRMRFLSEEPFPRVIGCLLGQHTGRCVDISNSFELLPEGSQDSPSFDLAVFQQKRDQYAECFKTLDLLGWYVTGSVLERKDLTLHKKFMELTEAPICILMDTEATCGPSVKDLPVTVYESAPYDMATSDAERIGIQAAADAVPTGGAPGGVESSAIAQHYAGLHSALKMFGERVRIILEHVQAMRAGRRPVNHQVLRMASGLVARMPGQLTRAIAQELADESTDATVVNLLCQVTKGADACASLADVAAVAFPARRT